MVLRTSMAAKVGNFPSGKVFLQILGCGIEDTAPSLFLFTDSKRYLFNCGEGMQRLFTEHKVKISKLATIFLTQNKWSHLGGFLGLSMTLRDIGKESIHLSGPVGVKQVIDGARYFLNKENVNFKVTEYSRSCTDLFEDDEISIKPVLIYPEANSRGLDHRQLLTSSNKDRKSPVTIHDVKRAARNGVVCYIAKLRDYPGKLLPKVAMSLGVPKGPMFRLLKDGQPVTLPCGKIVTPAEVTEAPIIGPSFLIVDCPAKKYIPGVVKNKTLKEFQNDGERESTMVVHMAEDDVINDGLYQSWMSSFTKGTYHLILNKRKLSQCPSVYATQFGMQYQLNQLHPSVFPLIETWRNPYSRGQTTAEAEKDSKSYLCRNLSKFNLRPKKSFGVDSSDELKQIDIERLVQETTETLAGSSHEGRSAERTNVADDRHDESKNNSNHKRMLGNSNGDHIEIAPAKKICKCKANTRDVHSSSEILEDKAKAGERSKLPYVVFLGTGSSIPSKYRNVSSILLHASPTSTVLLDCGEGSYGQVVNHFGEDAVDVIHKLKMIFISHLHADHHLGVIRILKVHWKELGEKDPSSYTPLLIAGPQRLATWLNEYATSCESLRFRFVDCAMLGRCSSSYSLSRKLSEFSEINTVPVDHHTEAYGIVLKHRDGWKITYSGDTEPCQNLVDAGKDSTLLIHEATFEDGMEEEAKEKHHSTCGQALEIAERMNAKNVLLTHFSQRYAKIPVMKNCTPVAVAFDHMQVHPDDIPEISKLLPRLQLLFPEESR